MHLGTKLLVGLLCAGVVVGCADNTPAAEGAALSPELFLSSDVAARNNAFLERELVFQEAVAVCMREQGFAYQPIDDGAETEAANRAFDATVGDQADTLFIGVVDRDYAERFGYGVARRFLEAPRTTFRPQPNPNVALLDALSDDEAEAYSNALGICEDDADQLVFAELVEFENVARDVAGEVDERLSADGAIIALERNWSGCVAAAGVDSLVSFVPDRPSELLYAVEEAAYGGIESDDIDPTEYWRDFQEFEQQVAIISSECAESLDFAEIYLGTRQELVERGLADRGYE